MPYVSPNIVIMPTVSLSNQTKSLQENLDTSDTTEKTSNLPRKLNVLPVVGSNPSQEAMNPADVSNTVNLKKMPKENTKPVGKDVMAKLKAPQREKNNENTSFEDCSTAKKPKSASWASSYLQSIGQQCTQAAKVKNIEVMKTGTTPLKSPSSPNTSFTHRLDKRHSSQTTNTIHAPDEINSNINISNSFERESENNYKMLTSYYPPNNGVWPHMNTQTWLSQSSNTNNLSSVYPNIFTYNLYNTAQNYTNQIPNLPGPSYTYDTPYLNYTWLDSYTHTTYRPDYHNYYPTKYSESETQSSYTNLNPVFSHNNYKPREDTKSCLTQASSSITRNNPNKDSGNKKEKINVPYISDKSNKNSLSHRNTKKLEGNKRIENVQKFSVSESKDKPQNKTTLVSSSTFKSKYNDTEKNINKGKNNVKETEKNINSVTNKNKVVKECSTKTVTTTSNSKFMKIKDFIKTTKSPSKKVKLNSIKKDEIDKVKLNIKTTLDENVTLTRLKHKDGKKKDVGKKRELIVHSPDLDQTKKKCVRYDPGNMSNVPSETTKVTRSMDSEPQLKIIRRKSYEETNNSCFKNKNNTICNDTDHEGLKNESTGRSESIKVQNHSSERLKKKRVRRSSSESPEDPPNKCIRYNSSRDKIIKHLRPKSKINLPNESHVRCRIKAPETNSSDEDQRTDFDLRSKLNRRNYKKHPEINQMLYDKTQTEKQRQNLMITVKHKDDSNSKQRSPGPTKPKLKRKKYKKIQLVINVLCAQPDDDSSDDSVSEDNSPKEVPNKSYEKRNLDLSFLDDINIDEIVNSLKRSPQRDNNSRKGVRQQVMVNKLDNKNKTTKQDKFVQPIIVKSEIKTEPSETGDILVDTLHKNISCEVFQEYQRESTSDNLLDAELSNCNTVPNDQNSKTITIKENNNVVLIKQEKQDSKLDITNSDSKKTEMAPEHLPTSLLDDELNKTVSQSMQCSTDFSCLSLETKEIKQELHKNVDDDIIKQDNITEDLSLKDYISLISPPELKESVTEKADCEIIIDLNCSEPEVPVTENKSVETNFENLCSLVVVPITAVNDIKQNASENSGDKNIRKENNTKVLCSSHSTEDVIEKVDNEVITGLTCTELNEVSATKNIAHENNLDILCPLVEAVKDKKQELCENSADRNVKHKNELCENSCDINIIPKSVTKVLCQSEAIDKVDSEVSKVTAAIKINDIKNVEIRTKEDKDNDIKTSYSHETNISDDANKIVIEAEHKTKAERDTTLIKSSENTATNNKPETRTVKIMNLSLKAHKVLAVKIEKNVFESLKFKLSVTTLIHEGRFSKIFQCKDSNDHNYAVKVLKPGSDEKIMKALQNDIPKEKLDTVYFINGFNLDKRWCFLMDYYPRNLRQALKSRAFHVDVVQSLARQLVSAVLAFKNNKIVHSDIRPLHILLDLDNQRLKVCGFDRSYYVDEVKIVPNIGTMSYRAPEVILGYSAGFGIDVWATGLVIYQMATGTQLFYGIYNNEMLFKHQSLLGNLPVDMVQNSPYAKNHFKGKLFMRKTEYLRQHILILKFNKTNIIRKSLIQSYKTFWSGTTKTEEAKLHLMQNLLEKMLVLDPRQRLGIESVCSDPFVVIK